MYEVTSFDVCVSGFERIRSNDEFILVAHVQHNTTQADLEEQFKSDIQSCVRDDNFDYDACNKVVAEFVAKINLASALYSVEAPLETDDGDNDASEYGCNAFLYIRRV